MDNERPRFRAEEFEQEAAFRWPEEFAESQKRISALDKDQQKQLKELGDWVNENLIICKQEDLPPHTPQVQKVVAKHFQWVSAFWQPDKSSYLALARMYENDPRYFAFYERLAPGMSSYLATAMQSFANSEL